MSTLESPVPGTATRPPRVAAFVAVSLVIGCLAQIADGFQELSEVSSRGGIWFAMLVVVGASAATMRSAAARAIGFGAMSLVGYYVMTTIDSGWSPPWATVWFWSAAAVTLAPMVAVVAHWTWHAGHRLAWLGFGAVGGVLLGEAVDVLLGESARRWPSLVVALVAGFAILVAGARRTGRPGAVAGVAALAVPLALAALWVLEVTYRWAIGGGLGSWI